MSKTYSHKTSYGKVLTVNYITTDDEAIAACKQLLSIKVIGYDIETTYKDGFANDPQAGLDPYRSRIRLVQFATPDGEIFVLDLFALSDLGKDAIREVLESDYPVKVGHNLKFDVKFARLLLGVLRFGRLFCTELASRLVMCGVESWRISLAKACKKYLNYELNKAEQRSDWSVPVLSDDQILYAAEDAYVVLPLRNQLSKKILQLDIVNAVKLEFDALDPVCQMELNGFFMNKERWLEADGLMHTRKLEVAEEIWKELAEVVPQQSLFEGAPMFKIGSKNVMTELLTDFGIELPDADPPKSKGIKKKVKQRERWVAATKSYAPVEEEVSTKKNKTTRNWKIKPLGDRFKVIAMLLEWRELNKRNTSYGEDYLENINPVTGRVHADFDPLRAVTGRYACSHPNLQQIPRLPAYRRCFMPELGWFFVSADYSQIELRLLAEFSGDEGFIQAFKSGLDFHDATTLQMFADKLIGAFPNGATIPPAKDAPEYSDWKKTEGFVTWTKYRTYAKNINFGIPYGMGAYTLALRTGMTVEEAETHLANYKAKFPHVIQYLNKCAGIVRRTHEIRTVSGRIARFEFDEKDRIAVAGAERNGKNTPIQGGNADILKRALRLLHEALYARKLFAFIKIVNIVHDEIITEAVDGYQALASELLEEAMKAAAEEVLKDVPVLVEAEVSQEWKK